MPTDALSRLLKSSTKAVDLLYFKLPTADGGGPIYRERVYCYELYHQMRRRWRRVMGHTDFVLNGEVDKSGHMILAQYGADGKIPDLLVHGPSDMGLNDTIIEVKPARLPWGWGRFRDDLDKLSLFRSEGVGYRRAILLVYGDDSDAFLNNIIAQVQAEFDGPEIELWTHACCGESAAFRKTIRWRKIR